MSPKTALEPNLKVDLTTRDSSGWLREAKTMNSVVLCMLCFLQETEERNVAREVGTVPERGLMGPGDTTKQRRNGGEEGGVKSI